MALYKYLWGQDSGGTLVIVGGKGASADNDWELMKLMTLPDLCGRALRGIDGMGGPVKNRLNGQVFAEGVYYPTLAGAYGGTSYGFISIAQLPVHTHTCQGAPTGISGTAGGPTGITGGAPTGVTTNNIVAGHSMYSKVTGITVTLDGVFVRSGSGQGSGDTVGVHGSEGEPTGRAAGAV